MGHSSLSRVERVLTRRDFDAVHRDGVGVRGRFLTLLAGTNRLGHARLGVAAGRKLGGAVARNRAKRLIREVFRRNKPTAGLDLVVIPRRELLEAEFKSLEADYRSTLRRCITERSEAATARIGRRARSSRGTRRV